MKEDKTVPQLRFPEFTDAWKQLKLSSYLDVSSEKNVDNFFSKDDVLSVSGDYGVVNQIEFQGRSFAGTSVSNYGVVHTGNVIYTKSPLKANPYGIIKTNKGESGIVSTLYAVYSVKENSFPNFIQDYFELNSRLNNYLRPLVNKGSKNDMKVSNENALKGLVIFPGLEEQRKISTFLAQLNNTITLQQRKLNSLQKLKKGLLQKMFPKKGENIPEIRFPEFSDAWKQRELGEIAERVTRRNSSLESQTPLTISAEYGLIDQNKFFGKRIAAKDLSNYYLIQKGEFAYNKSTSNDAPWGAIKRLDCYNNGALSTLYIVFKIKDNKSCYSDFLVTYYGTSLWHKGVKEIATEGARNHGLLNVSPSDFFRTKLVIPQDFEEQRKIGAFFTQLDNTITLQQRWLFYTHKQS